MTKPIYILNGPNLNLLGMREPKVYGTDTLDDIRRMLEADATRLGLAIVFRQTNSEGQLIDWVQEARGEGAAIIVNPAGLTHSSVALLDALLAVDIPVVEVHLSNIHRRERFRRHSYVSLGATGVICGLGARGYRLALEVVTDLVGTRAISITDEKRS